MTGFWFAVEYQSSRQTDGVSTVKREEFLITSTKGHNATKYKWNSARKEVQRLMQEYVNQQGVKELLSILEYKLIENESEKEGFYHVSGVMTVCVS